MEEALEFFRDNGFYVQHGALSPAEVATARDGMAAAALAHPDEWQVSEANRVTARRAVELAHRDLPER